MGTKVETIGVETIGKMMRIQPLSPHLNQVLGKTTGMKSQLQSGLTMDMAELLTLQAGRMMDTARVLTLQAGLTTDMAMMTRA